MRNKILDYLWIPIGIASFFLFSSQFFPLLNSDDAINILMIKDLSLPHDLFAWGQDRGGSLIPLLAWPLHHVLGLSVVMAESIIHFLILFIGFWFLSQSLKSRMSRIIFSILWFLPCYWFLSFIRFPFGIQYSLIGVVVYLLFVQKNEQPDGRPSLSRLVIVLVFLSLALWVSDLSLTSIIALLLLLTVSIKKIRNAFLDAIKWPGLYMIIFSCVLTWSFISYAKNQSFRTELYNHSMINDLHQIKDSIVILLTSLWDILSFRKETWMLSIYGILAITLILILLLVKPKISGGKQHDVTKFFLTDSFILLLVIILSHWAFLNGDSRRYFSGMYIGLALVILIGIENLTGRRKDLLHGLALLLVIFGGISSIHYFKKVYPKSLKPMINVVGEFKSLGEVGIISEYWNSYISACPDPYKITAIPHDSSFNRKPEQIEEVFSKPKLYIIKDMWLNQFPDSIEQYGYLLKRKGDSILIGNCIINEYERALRIQVFNPNDLVTIQGHAVKDSLSSRIIIHADSNCLECKSKHLVYGPGIKLGKGKYDVGFYIRFTGSKEESELAIIDVTADYGNTKITSKSLKTDEVKVGIYEYYWLSFENTTEQEYMEFRILSLGNSSISFDHLILKEK